MMRNLVFISCKCI